MAAGSDAIGGVDEVGEISELSHDYFGPESGNSVYPEVARLWQFQRAAQTMDGFLVRFDLARRKAETQAQMRGPFRR